MQKPVWRLNTGNGVPSDLAGMVMLVSGKTRASRDHKKWFADLRYSRWEILGVPSDIYAYQTNRTRKAKYR